MRAPILALALSAPLTLWGSPAAEDEIKSTLRAMWDALERGDLEAYAAHLHPDFSSFGENDVYLSEGRDLELRSYRAYLSRAKSTRTEMHQPRVTVRGEMAFVTYYWTESAEIEGRRVTSRGKSTRIFVKEGGRWLSLHGHYTAVP
jgi:ketosteroid isomerase-like protein